MEPIQPENTQSIELSKIDWIAKNFSLENAKILGVGGFGTVLSLFSPQHNRELAVKIMRPSKDDTEIMDLFNEVRILKKLKPCEFVVTIQDAFLDTIANMIIISMEKADYSLKTKIKNEPLPQKELERCFRHIVEALHFAYQEKNGFAHLDIKPPNILCFKEKNGQIKYKLSDWGSGKIISSKTRVKAITKNFCPPEILDEEDNLKIPPNYDYQKADVYSLGLTLLICLGVKTKNILKGLRKNNQKNYEKDMKEIFKEAQKGKENLTNIIKVLEKMTCFLPSERPDVGTLLKIAREPVLSERNGFQMNSEAFSSLKNTEVKNEKNEKSAKNFKKSKSIEVSGVECKIW